MKPLVISHANCSDGFGAALAAWKKFGEEADYVFLNYGKEQEEFMQAYLHEQRPVYILDFSFPAPFIRKLLETSERLTWLDHHKTSFEAWCPQAGCPDELSFFEMGGDLLVDLIRLDNSKSGAVLAWEHFHGYVPALITYIDDYDRWQFKLEGTREIQRALWSYTPWTFELWWDTLLSGEGLHSTSLVMEGLVLLRGHHQNVQEALRGAGHCNLPTASAFPLPGLMANAPRSLASDLGHELATRSGTYGLVWQMMGDGRVSCSLRSEGEYDVSSIAKQFGGGGHRNAAGFELSDGYQLLQWGDL